MSRGFFNSLKSLSSSSAETIAVLWLTGCASRDQLESLSVTTSTVTALMLEVVAMGTPFSVKDKSGSIPGNVTLLAAEKNPQRTVRYGASAKPDGTAVAVQLRVETPADCNEQKFMRTTERGFSEFTTG